MKVIAVVGPTASGKTKLGIELAKQFNGEIISADSMQIYKNMPIANAVATKEEQDGIPHHLIEFLDQNESFSVFDFVTLAKEIIEDIDKRNKVPIIVGGTGLFVDSLLNGIRFGETQVDEEYHAKLVAKTNEELFEILKSLDEKSSKEIHINNKKKVIRAIEICKSTGKTKEEVNKESKLNQNQYDSLYIGITYKDRQQLYDRINKRVDIMIENGLENEARKSIDINKHTAKQAIGHKELLPYINGEITLEKAVDNLKKETRHYAKRQLTWFRRNKSINWLFADDYKTNEEMVNCAIEIANNFLKG